MENVEEENAISVSDGLKQFDKPGDKPLTPETEEKTEEESLDPPTEDEPAAIVEDEPEEESDDIEEKDDVAVEEESELIDDPEEPKGITTVNSTDTGDETVPAGNQTPRGEEDETGASRSTNPLTPSHMDSSAFVLGGDAKDPADKEVKVSLTGTSTRQVAPEAARKPLLTLLYDLGSKDADIVMESLAVMGSMELNDKDKLNKNPKEKALITKGTAAMELLRALQNHGMIRDDVAVKGLGLLLSLTAMDEKGCQEAMVELNGTKIVIQTMRKHQKNLDIQIHSLGILSNMSVLGKEEVAKIARSGGIDAIIDDMLAWPDLPYIQRRGCKIFANMAEAEKKKKKKKNILIKEEIRKKKGVSIMGKCLETFPEDSSTFFEARRAMRCFF